MTVPSQSGLSYFFRNSCHSERHFDDLIPFLILQWEPSIPSSILIYVLLTVSSSPSSLLVTVQASALEQCAAADFCWSVSRRRRFVPLLMCTYFVAIFNDKKMKKGSSENFEDRTKLFRESLKKLWAANAAPPPTKIYRRNAADTITSAHGFTLLKNISTSLKLSKLQKNRTSQQIRIIMNIWRKLNAPFYI